MKSLILFLFSLVTFSTFAQKKQIIFMFEKGKDTVILKKNARIYKLGNNQTYKFTKKNKEVIASYQSVKEHIFTFDDFLKLNKGKEFPKYYDDFSFYIFIKGNQEEGCLIEVDKVWLVENEIIN